MVAPQALGKPPRRRDVGYRQDAWNDLDLHPGAAACVPEAEEAVGREEELRDRSVGARIHFPL